MRWATPPGSPKAVRECLEFILPALGHGGLCLGCPQCRYPVCPFGKS